MEPLSDDLRERMLVAVDQWAAGRYQARLKDVPAEHIMITRASGDSAFDYLVRLDSLVGSAPLRLKVTIDHDGSFHIRD
ncbi:MAG: hypothetical protein M3R24_14680 [Chloroflexota bacterium]|nr:hypothetical protein [Chloroflexota bacterium]PLS77475.1 MAG: hypothetical protein CYG59_23620 [Chloroflexota bacterium]